MRKVAKISLIIYSVFLLTFILVEFSPLEFTDVLVKTFFYEYTLLGIPLFGLLLGIYFIKKQLWNVVAGVGLAIVGCLLLNSIAFSFVFWHSHSIWETKEIIAVHKIKHKTFIAEQWIDSGALGYSKGIYKITPITSFLSWKVNFYGETLDENWDIKSNRKLEIGY